MLQAFAPPKRRVTLGLFVLCGGLAIAAALVGLSDNPPGLLLALLAGMAAVTAFVHPWRTARKFRYLAYCSVLGLGLFAVLHNVFEAIAGQGTGALSKYALEPLAVTAFLVAILVCPAGFLVGIIGALVTFIRGRRHPPGSAAQPAIAADSASLSLARPLKRGVRHEKRNERHLPSLLH